MKIIEHSYGADLSWVENLAQEYGGKIDGNFIIAPESDIATGTRYFLDCGEGIIAYPFPPAKPGAPDIPSFPSFPLIGIHFVGSFVSRT
ncbi:hypothetical protein CLU81_0330 [Flavobacterium sp. 9]|nr:hypothetical protein CLU81_0330 [Flavobacterium sp. 9]